MGRRIDGYLGGEGAEAWEIVESVVAAGFSLREKHKCP